MNVVIERHPGHGLELSVHRYRDEAAAPRGITALLVHGFMDAGGTWEDVAGPLAAQGIDVWAPDMRGFGRSDRVGPGGYYHFPDYLSDVDALIHGAMSSPDRLLLVGHSMGGTICSLYAGTRPERVERLVLLEGIGPPATAPEVGPVRMKRWLDQLREGPGGRPPASRDDALRRLTAVHARVDRAILARKVEHLVTEREGTLSWAYDPLHRTTAPYRFDADAFRCFLREVRCPTLFIGGGTRGFHPPDEQERLEMMGGAVESIDLSDAGHMMHWTRPAEVADAILRFALASGLPPTPTSG